MDPIQLWLSLAGIAVRSQRLMIDFLTRRPDLSGLNDPAGIGQAFLDLTAKMIVDPMPIAQMQLELWKEHVKLLQRTTERLPWSFVLKDRTWHLVLACRNCNNQKRDRLTDTASLERLCDRNDDIRSGDLYVDHAFRRHFEEWQTRNLSSYVKGLYDQAVADGFPKWM